MSPISTGCPESTVPEVCVSDHGWTELLDDCCSHGLCETSDGHSRWPPASLRRMLCDAVVYPAVLGGSGEVLDSGRGRSGPVNRKQRRALRAMHRTLRPSRVARCPFDVVPHPPRPLVDPRPRPVRPRQSAAAL